MILNELKAGYYNLNVYVTGDCGFDFTGFISVASYVTLRELMNIWNRTINLLVVANHSKLKCIRKMRESLFCDEPEYMQRRKHTVYL